MCVWVCVGGNGTKWKWAELAWGEKTIRTGRGFEEDGDTRTAGESSKDQVEEDPLGLVLRSPGFWAG